MDEALRKRMQTLEKVRRLPQVAETWEAIARRSRTWVTPAAGPLVRPYAVLIATAGADVIVRTGVLEHEPAPQDVFTELLHAMVRPTPSGGPPRRPRVIVVDDEPLGAILTPWLADLEIQSAYQAALPDLHAAMDDLEVHLNRGHPLRPGLLTIPGVDAPLVAHLYGLVAEFYRQAPWRWMDDRHVLAISCPADTAPRWAVVLGSMNTIHGLAVYDTLEDLQRTLADDGEDPAPPSATLVFFFDKPQAMSFDDLDAIEQYDWAVAGPQAFPIFTRPGPDMEPLLPPAADLVWLDGALGGLLYYLGQYGRTPQGRARRADFTTPVRTVAGEVAVAVRVPALPAAPRRRAARRN